MMLMALSVARQLSLPLGQAQRKRAQQMCRTTGASPQERVAFSVFLAEGHVHIAPKNGLNMAFGQTTGCCALAPGGDAPGYGEQRPSANSLPRNSLHVASPPRFWCFCR